MTVIRQYNSTTDEWDVVAVGQAGLQGVTGPTGPAGPTGPRQYVDITPPASPITGDQWFNSELARQFVYYDNAWVEIGNAFRGDPGIVASTSAPTDTSVLWLDTDEDADGAYVPAGGVSGSVLRKASSANYDLEWSGEVVTTSIVTAKGDIISGTAAGTVGKTSVGTNGQMLVADAAQAGGVNWRRFPAGDQIVVYPNTVDGVNYYAGGSTANLLDTAFSVKGVCLLKTALISSMASYVTASSGVGATYRMAIYGDDGFGRPGTLLWNSDSIDASTIGSKRVSGINVWAPAGMVYVTAILISGAITVHGVAGSTSGNEATPRGGMGDNLPRGGRYNTTTTGGAAPSTPTWTLGNGGGAGVAIQFDLTFSQVIQ